MFTFDLDLIKDIRNKSFIFGFFCAFLGIFAITIPQPIAAIICSIGLVCTFDAIYFSEDNFVTTLLGWLIGFLFSLLYVVVLNVKIVFVPISCFLLFSAFFTGYIIYALMKQHNYYLKRFTLCLIGCVSQMISASAILYLFIFDIINVFLFAGSLCAMCLGYLFGRFWLSS